MITLAGKFLRFIKQRVGGPGKITYFFTYVVEAIKDFNN